MYIKSNQKIFSGSLAFSLIIGFLSIHADAKSIHQATSGNFGLPGIIDLPTAKSFPDGELVITQQLHTSLARSGIAFQALPRLGVAFRYSGHGIDGGEAYGRVNHDRSFDLHISIFDEGKYLPGISLGLRDFIGTGWYSSEYIVGTKSIGDLEITAGLGMGRLSGRNSFSNPFELLSPKFTNRQKIKMAAGGQGGAISLDHWFTGNASAFYGLNYRLNKKIKLLAEYTPDLMLRENSYLNIKSPLNIGATYEFNDYMSISAQYLHGSQVSLTGHISINPKRPPLLGGKELAPVPMRIRGKETTSEEHFDDDVITKVLSADLFEIYELKLEGNKVNIIVKNRKFRSTAQAVGRIASTLQRFTSDSINLAQISFATKNLITATYIVDLEVISKEQFDPLNSFVDQYSIEAIDTKASIVMKNQNPYSWGIGPYIAHRLFNPDLPLSAETGIEAVGGYQLAPGIELSGTLRKSILTNLTDNNRRSNSVLPRVHSDWPLYDFAGQSGPIHALTLSYMGNIAPSFYARAHAGLLEPFFAGVGGEILFKPAQSPIGLGIDLHHVRKRAYEMRFDLLDYETTVGHFSLYYDAGGMLDLEINAGKYLAGDLGVTTTISRKFGSGWEVGGYATFTDVPFNIFGEGSFDKAIYVSIPIDWIMSSPNRTRRRLTLRPITRDGGANLSSARKLYQYIEQSQTSNFQREFGRLWR